METMIILLKKKAMGRTNVSPYLHLSTKTLLITVENCGKNIQKKRVNNLEDSMRKDLYSILKVPKKLASF